MISIYLLLDYLFGFFQFLSELQLLKFCVDAVGDFLELLF